MLSTILFWSIQGFCISIIVASAIGVIVRLWAARKNELNRPPLRLCDWLVELPRQAGMVGFLVSILTVAYVLDVSLFVANVNMMPTLVHHAMFFMYPGCAVFILGIVVSTVCKWLRARHLDTGILQER